MNSTAAARMREAIAEALRNTEGRTRAVDVGAHHGHYSLAMAEHFREVVAFEPVAANFAGLLDTIAAVKNITAINVGVSDRCGRENFDIDGKSIGCHIAENGESCAVMRLDTLDWDAVDYLKIDVEGHEYQALRGAALVIKMFHPVIMIEEKFDPKYRASRLLHKWGYSMIWQQKHDRLFRWKR